MTVARAKLAAAYPPCRAKVTDLCPVKILTTSWTARFRKGSRWRPPRRKSRSAGGVCIDQATCVSGRFIGHARSRRVSAMIPALSHCRNQQKPRGTTQGARDTRWGDSRADYARRSFSATMPIADVSSQGLKSASDRTDIRSRWPFTQPLPPASPCAPRCSHALLRGAHRIWRVAASDSRARHCQVAQGPSANPPSHGRQCRK